MVTWSVICLPIAPPQPHASSHRTLVVVVAHHCSTVTHPRTDQATLTHPQMNQLNHCAHPPTNNNHRDKIGPPLFQQGL